MQYTYILATQAHIPQLIEARVDFLSDYWGRPEEAAERRLREELAVFFENELAAGTYVSWLALYEGELVGLGGMKIFSRPGSFRVPDGRCAYIMNMYTVPAHRKRGIATELLRRLQQSGAEAGIRFFELHATHEGEPVYVKDGFKLHGEPTYRKFVA